MSLLLQRRLLLICAALATTTALAADPARGTKEEAKALAEAAAAHVNKVGGEQAFKDFADAKWHPKDMYVFAQNMDAGGRVPPPGTNVVLSWAPESTFVVDRDPTASEEEDVV